MKGDFLRRFMLLRTNRLLRQAVYVKFAAMAIGWRHTMPRHQS